MNQPTTMRTDAIELHPRHEQMFGRTSERSLDLLRASMLTRGCLEPVVITPFDAIDNPKTVVNGNDRVRVALELGLSQLPVVVNESLRTEGDQIDAMFHYAQRKDFTWSQRAKQAQAVRTMLASLSPAERQRRYQGKQPQEIVAMVLRQPRRNVSRMQVVFQSPTATDELKSAVDQGKLSLYEADLIVQEAERRRAPGSRNARRLVNELLVRALRARQERKAKKHTRAPRTPVFDAKPKRPAFLRDIQKQLLDWALSETPANVRDSHAHAPLFSAAVKDFMVDVRAAATAFRVKVNRVARFGTGPNSPLDNVRVVNDALQVLGLGLVKRLDDVDLDEVRRTHRVMARAYHPDLNDASHARDEFERVHGAYERIVELCDGR